MYQVPPFTTGTDTGLSLSARSPGQAAPGAAAAAIRMKPRQENALITATPRLS